MGYAVAVAIKLYAQILVDECFDGVAVIVRDDWKRPQCFGLKAIYRTLAGFAMEPLVSDLSEPLTGLAIHVVKVGKLAQRPETLACIADSPLHFSLLPTGRYVAGFRIKAILAGEGEKTWVEANQASVM